MLVGFVIASSFVPSLKSPYTMLLLMYTNFFVPNLEACHNKFVVVSMTLGMPSMGSSSTILARGYVAMCMTMSGWVLKAFRHTSRSSRSPLIMETFLWSQFLVLQAMSLFNSTVDIIPYVSLLSTHVTRCPSCDNFSMTLVPMNPSPPVIKNFIKTPSLSQLWDSPHNCL